MVAPGLPPNEAERLRSLAEHDVVDTLPEAVYTDITRLAAELCGTPRAALNLIAEERQWSKAAVGFVGESMPRDYSFCAHTILNPHEALLVPDARFDERFHDNPNTLSEPPLVFYAGVPVQDAEGRALGALCVLDSRPRDLSEAKLDSLKALAKLVSTHLQLRRTKLELEKSQQQLVAAQPLLQTMKQAIEALSTKENVAETPHLTVLHQSVDSMHSALKLPVAAHGLG
jgi:GAF domain-containing protein